LVSRLVLRGVLAGVVAGLLAGGFAYVAGEPQVERAIAIEQRAASSAPAGHAEAPPVSRGAQRGGLFVATTLFGLCLGGMFGLVFAFTRGRAGPAGELGHTAFLALCGFTALTLIPFIKYPANPPAVGDPSTVTDRTLLYLVMVAIGVLVVAAAVRVAREAGPAVRALAATLTLAFTVGVAVVLLPQVDEVPAGFPATLLWDFRVASLGTQIVLWAALGLGFALLAERDPSPAAG
jgi:predicted cobalt transporter CbtA